MATITDQSLEYNRNGHMALGQKVGLTEVIIDVSVATLATDVFEAIVFESAGLVLCAGIEVLTPTTLATTGSLGENGGVATLLAATLLNTSAGTKTSGGQGLANVLVAAGDTLDLTLAAQIPGAGSIRVWAVVAGIENLDGSGT